MIYIISAVIVAVISTLPLVIVKKFKLAGWTVVIVFFGMLWKLHTSTISTAHPLWETVGMYTIILLWVNTVFAHLGLTHDKPISVFMYVPCLVVTAVLVGSLIATMG